MKAALIALLLVSSTAYAAPDKDVVTKLCGTFACEEISKDNVGETEGAYYLLSSREIIPYGDEVRSYSGGYYRCERKDGTFCCIVVPRGK